MGEVAYRIIGQAAVEELDAANAATLALVLQRTEALGYRCVLPEQLIEAGAISAVPRSASC